MTIKCDIHGDFTQSPNKHKTGRGCPKCGMVSTIANRVSTGWAHTDWEKAGSISKNFDSFKVYIIRCYNEEESFIKIGKTFKKVSGRFTKLRDMPYNYEILKVIEGESRAISELELELHNLNKEFMYTPLKVFSGSTECFSELKEETFADSK